jgi:antitoxin component YwqK of YwqJK toxin-antitoxin module
MTNAVERINIMDPEVDQDIAERYLYRGELYTGEAVELGPDGAVRGLWTLTDGLEDGPQRGWYPDGTLQSDGVCRRGTPVGEWRSWHPNGQLESLRVFTDNGDLLSASDWAPDGTEIKNKRHWDPE